ncbi:unnamed protein product (macronuclear) [Paramecium tetraurelia]|uniref:Uncharacterized protein n=1 Tax=Paramecium tetraurelia TaxID=5888 RepID=A0BCF1_PARTE|nr:uncharacterized protein GSPATT00004312001 [Paramecium tetraurelia]CAK56218.1 unnamed protein product [Paramecium tetraurelia]|eukprot:XP_001423616.1 hypothetical protein (macronuclear) [Paramecium tetraurelia strain d4-2]
MNSCQFKNRSLHINKFHSLTPSHRNQYSNRQNEQVFSFSNEEQVSQRKYMPFIYTKYKPYSHQRRMQNNVAQSGDYFNSTIEQTSFNQFQLKSPCSISPLRKKTLNSFLFTDCTQNQQQSPINCKSEVRQFSFDLPQMQMQQFPRKREYTIFKKKKKVYALKMQNK